MNSIDAYSLMSNLLRLNVPLCQWRKRTGEGRAGGYGGEKNDDKLAQNILSQCSHRETVELVAMAWDGIPSRVRIMISTLASKGNCSGNVRKGLQNLNNRLGGRLLREERERTYQVRVETPNGAMYIRKRVDEAKAGAMRKYQKV